MRIYIILMGFYLVNTAHAGTGLNCYKADEMQGNELNVCLQQSDDWLNSTYQQLLAKQVDEKRKHLLKTAQRAWIKMRDADCLLSQLNAVIAPSVAKDRCVIKATLQRNDFLEDWL